MTQRTRGLYRFLQWPGFYSTFQCAIGAERMRRVIIDTFVRPATGDSLLDLGCGPGSMLRYLGDITYTGVDLNADHVAAARQLAERVAPHATFLRGDASAAAELGVDFDKIIAIGLLHHLTDGQVCELAVIIRRLLRPNGIFVAIDPTFTPGQHWIARYLAAHDTGRQVRPAAGYSSLLATAFSNVRSVVSHDLLRVPFSHAITIAN